MLTISGSLLWAVSKEKTPQTGLIGKVTHNHTAWSQETGQAQAQCTYTQRAVGAQRRARGEDKAQEWLQKQGEDEQSRGTELPGTCPRTPVSGFTPSILLMGARVTATPLTHETKQPGCPGCIHPTTTHPGPTWSSMPSAKCPKQPQPRTDLSLRRLKIIQDTKSRGRKVGKRRHQTLPTESG